MSDQLELAVDVDTIQLLDHDGNVVVVPIEGLVVRPGLGPHRYGDPRSVLRPAPPGPGTPRHMPPYRTGKR